MDDIIDFVETASLEELRQWLVLLDNSSKFPVLKEKIRKMVSIKTELSSFVAESFNHIP